MRRYNFSAGQLRFFTDVVYVPEHGVYMATALDRSLKVLDERLAVLTSFPWGKESGTMAKLLHNPTTDEIITSGAGGIKVRLRHQPPSCIRYQRAQHSSMESVCWCRTAWLVFNVCCDFGQVWGCFDNVVDGKRQVDTGEEVKKFDFQSQAQLTAPWKRVGAKDTALVKRLQLHMPFVHGRPDDSWVRVCRCPPSPFTLSSLCPTLTLPLRRARSAKRSRRTGATRVRVAWSCESAVELKKARCGSDLHGARCWLRALSSVDGHQMYGKADV